MLSNHLNDLITQEDHPSGMENRAYIFIMAVFQKQTNSATSALLYFAPASVMHAAAAFSISTPGTHRHPSVVPTQRSSVFFKLCGFGSGFYPHGLSFISPDPITDKKGRGRKIRPLFGVIPEAAFCSSTQTSV